MKVDWDELKRLHEAATAGEWLVFAEGKLTDLHIAGNNSPIVHWIGFDGSDRPRTHNRANAKCIAALHNAWPSILAERSAAQRLRDAADEARSWMTMPKAEGTLKPTVANVGANQRRIVAELQSALAAFDKETA